MDERRKKPLTEKEKHLRHKRYLERKKKQEQKRERIIFAVIAVIVIVAIITGGSMWFFSAGGTSNKDKTLAKLSTSEPVMKINQEQFQSMVATQKTNISNAAQNAVMGDRSKFAVKEGVTVGSLDSSDEKIVYLTLDDGPSVNTQKVLDILDKYNCKATFFVTNINPEYKDLIKKAYDAGHTIGLHTYSHDYAKLYASEDAYFDDLIKIGEVVKEQIGYVPAFIRFPGGASNGISKKYCKGIMSKLTQDVVAKGYQYYDWNCSSGDGGNCDTATLVANATSVSYNNIMLLSHDSNGKETTVEALPQIIEHYQAQGYVFKAIDTESFAAHHKTNN